MAALKEIRNHGAHDGEHSRLHHHAQNLSANNRFLDLRELSASAQFRFTLPERA